MIPIYNKKELENHLINFTKWQKSRGYRYLPGVNKFYNYNGVEIKESEMLKEYENNSK